jgi:hypothetical protein
MAMHVGYTTSEQPVVLLLVVGSRSNWRGLKGASFRIEQAAEQFNYPYSWRGVNTILFSYFCGRRPYYDRCGGTVNTILFEKSVALFSGEVEKKCSNSQGI